jgi:ABC-type multidrug transport system ATPase subunit
MPGVMTDESKEYPQVWLSEVGKQYSGRWIFKGITACFHSGNRIAITGPNGTGKSTLLQIIAGFITPSSGQIRINTAQGESGREIWVLAAPYMEMPEEFTLREIIEFYFAFKTMRLPVNDLLEECGLRPFLSCPLREFSSGMKQKVKLSLVFASRAILYLFDEPCAHLDQPSMEWYQKNLMLLPSVAIAMVASNSLPAEISTCTKTLALG